MNDNSYVIDLDSLPGGVTSRALTLGQDVLTAFVRAMDDSVTYVYANGQLVACIAPPEAGERFEHAGKVMVQSRTSHDETVPVTTRAERGRRRRLFGWGPFEGVFR